MKVNVIKSWPETEFPNADFLLFSETVATKTPTVPSFRDSLALAQTVTELATAFRPYAAMQKQDISANMRQIIIAKREELTIALKRLANFVELHCDDNSALVQETGLAVKAKPSPMGRPPQCLDIKVNKQVAPAGVAAFSVKPYLGAASYLVEYGIEGTEERMTATFPSSRIRMEGLQSGKRYVVNVSYIGRGKNGTGDASSDLVITVQ